MPTYAHARAAALIVTSTIVAIVCARLGVWQVDRLGERRALNALLMARMRDPVIPVSRLPADTGAGHYRVATAHGTFDYAHELVWAARVRQGSPGVNLLTPMRVDGVDGMLLVNRGWVYSPDAKSVQHARWRERDTATVTGYVETWQQTCGVTATTFPPTCGDTAERVLRRLDRAAATRLVGAPVAAYLLVQTSDSALRADSVPARIGEPTLDEGPHFGYAVQWFAFATIALVGGTALALRRANG
jgi:surfeit locus 1 family protein